MRSLRKEILIIFVLACFASMIVSSAVAVLLNADAMTQELQETEAEIVFLSWRLREADVDIDELGSMLSRFGDYRLEKCEKEVDLSDKERERLEKNGYVDVGWQADTRTYFYMDGEMYVIYAESGNIFAVRSTLEGYLNVACTVIILFMLVYIIGVRIVTPVSEMSVAAGRIGAGDFDAKVNAKLKRKYVTFSRINQLVDNFNQMADDLKSIAYLRDDFARNLSHEVKTPIAAISGYAQLMESGNLSQEEIREFSHLMREELTQLTRLSDNMLRITRMENRNQKPNLAYFSLDEQLRRMVAGMYPLFQEKGIDVDISLARVKIMSDEELLSQVWTNLLDNAKKFTPSGGSVRIHLETDALYASVSIQDTGIGISQEELRHVFDKFYQADTSHRTEGSGLGLPLSKRIVEALGGEISVISGEKGGSEFTVRLPMEPVRGKEPLIKGRKADKGGVNEHS